MQVKQFLYSFILCLLPNCWHLAINSSAQAQPNYPLTAEVQKSGDKRLQKMLAALTKTHSALQQQYNNTEYKNGTDQIKKQTATIKEAVNMAQQESDTISELECQIPSQLKSKKTTPKHEYDKFIEKINQLNLLRTQSTILVKSFNKPIMVDAETQTDDDEQYHNTSPILPASPIFNPTSDTTSESSKSVESISNSDTESGCPSVASTSAITSVQKSVEPRITPTLMPAASPELCTLFKQAVSNDIWELVGALARSTQLPQELHDFALFRAAGAANIESLNVLLDKNANPSNFQDGYTPLHVAAANGADTIIQKLVDSKACVNAPVLAQDEAIGLTPVQIAAKKGLKDSVALLVTLKANITAKDLTGKSALDYLRALQPKESAPTHHKKSSTEPTSGLINFLKAGSPPSTATALLLHPAPATTQTPLVQKKAKKKKKKAVLRQPENKITPIIPGQEQCLTNQELAKLL